LRQFVKIDQRVRTQPFAVAGGTKVKASAAGLMPLFQLLTRSVYCGALLMVLLVITSLRGNRTLAHLYPELPVGIQVAESEVLALDAVDHSRGRYAWPP
jgi:hypothetical protein